jgi:hypothetical protein
MTHKTSTHKRKKGFDEDRDQMISVRSTSLNQIPGCLSASPASSPFFFDPRSPLGARTFLFTTTSSTATLNSTDPWATLATLNLISACSPLANALVMPILGSPDADEEDELEVSKQERFPSCKSVGSVVVVEEEGRGGWEY